jgi:hypothetical protein
MICKKCNQDIPKLKPNFARKKVKAIITGVIKAACGWGKCAPIAIGLRKEPIIGT